MIVVKTFNRPVKKNSFGVDSIYEDINTVNVNRIKDWIDIFTCILMEDDRTDLEIEREDLYDSYNTPGNG